MAYHVYLVDDPVKGPTHGQRCNNTSMLYFKSFGIGGNAPPPFSLVFDYADFNGRYSVAQSSPAVVGGGKITFQSVASGSKFQRVIIKLTSATPPDGYAYDVVMASGTWDPRVVPF